jgi:enoyl-CoA hydratase/carnithine racemase
LLPRLVGPSKALELVWSARMIPAAEALALGVFDRVVPAERLAVEAKALAASWAAQPALALRRAKEGVYQSGAASLEAMLDWEIATQHELFGTADARERIAQSLSKRSR